LTERGVFVGLNLELRAASRMDGEMR